MLKEYIQPRLLAIPCYMLCFFVFKVLFYTVKRWEIYSFFSEGKKREGKSSFCIFVGKRVGQNTKCAFPYAMAVVFIFDVESLKFSISFSYIIIVVANIVIAYFNIEKAVASF